MKTLCISGTTYRVPGLAAVQVDLRLPLHPRVLRRREQELRVHPHRSTAPDATLTCPTLSWTGRFTLFGPATGFVPSNFFMPTAILAEAFYFSRVLKILACFKIFILVFSHLNVLHRTQIHQQSTLIILFIYISLPLSFSLYM